MPHSTFDFNIASVEADNVLLKAHFSNGFGATIQLTLNSNNHSVRLHYKNNSRLYFFEPQAFGTTRFKDEYGQSWGRLRSIEVHRGSILIGDSTYQYRFAGEDPHVLVHPPGLPVGLSFEINDEFLRAPTNEGTMSPFLFSFGLVYHLDRAPA